MVVRETVTRIQLSQQLLRDTCQFVFFLPQDAMVPVLHSLEFEDRFVLRHISSERHHHLFATFSDGAAGKDKLQGLTMGGEGVR